MLLLFLLASFSQAEVVGKNRATAEILWDNYGVPHIYAQNQEVLAYAFGYAHGRSYGTTLLSLYGRGRGKAAEYWGGTLNLGLDIFMWTNRIPQLADESYYAQDPNSRVICDAFAEGFTDYINAHREDFNPSLLVVLPIEGIDVLRHGFHVLFYFLYVGSQTMRGTWMKDFDRTSDPFFANETAYRHFSAYADYNPLDELSEDVRANLGSNAWAINSLRGASPNGMLVQNPHLPYFWFFRWYEAHLVIESEGLDLYGANLLGVPVLNIAFNEFLGWTHTVNVQRAYTGYELLLTTPGGSTYIFDDRVLPITTTSHTVYELDNGTLIPHEVVIEYSVHGPIIGRRGQRAFAVRLAGVDDLLRPDYIKQWWDMGRAKKLHRVEGCNRPKSSWNVYHNVCRPR